jgi:hypothetical protein
MRIARRHHKCSPLLSWVLVSLAVLSIMPWSLLAKDDNARGMPPQVERFVRWLPEDTETLFVARSVTLPVAGLGSLDDKWQWQDVALGLACEGVFFNGRRQFGDYDVRLMPSLKNVHAIPTAGRALLVVAAVNNVLQFRIFDGNGKRVADTDEKKLPAQPHQIENLRKQLESLWPPHELGSGERSSVITAVASLVDRAQLEPLRGRKVEWLVHGATNYDGVSSLGSLRSEGCTIIVFEKNLGNAAREWNEGLRPRAQAIRTVAGREVIVLPSPTEMERWVKETEWQGIYFVLLEPNIVLCASSDRYLEAVLRRVDTAPKMRALPDQLPEWKHVDFDAPLWMIRHVPKPGEKAHTVGVTATFRKNAFHVAYVSKTDAEVNAKQVRDEWLRGCDSQVVRDQLTTARQADGSVVLSYGHRKIEDEFWFFFQLYWLQAFELSYPEW